MNSFRCLFTCLCLAIFATVIHAEEPKKQVDPSGTWRWEYDLRGETVQETVKLQLGKEGKVTGTLHTSRRKESFNIKHGRIEGDELSFQVTVEFSGNPVDLSFSGTVKGDDISGNVEAEVDSQIMQFPWTPARGVKLSDVVGIWELIIKMPDNDVEAKLVIEKDGEKYKGIHSGGRIGEVAAEKLAIRENYLMYSIEANFEGTDFEGHFKGRPYGNKITGTFDVEANGDVFQLPFTGSRQVKKAVKSD